MQNRCPFSVFHQKNYSSSNNKNALCFSALPLCRQAHSMLLPHYCGKNRNFSYAIDYESHDIRCKNIMHFFVDRIVNSTIGLFGTFFNSEEKKKASDVSFDLFQSSIFISCAFRKFCLTHEERWINISSLVQIEFNKFFGSYVERTLFSKKKKKTSLDSCAHTNSYDK